MGFVVPILIGEKAATTAPRNYEPPQIEFDVVLLDVGPNRVAVLKVLRKWTRFSLVECGNLTRNLPVPVFNHFREDAEACAADFRASGATVEIR